MATRRMFSRVITESARFLRMPATSRLLYYDLGMQADDDGVVEAFTVIRTTGASEDDLRVLATKGFITVLNEDLVSFINDWKVNNLIKKDRYHPSAYADLLVRLTDGTDLETYRKPDGTQLESKQNPSDRLNGTQNDVFGSDAGTHLEPQVRLGKDSIGKGSLVEYSQEQDSEVEERGGLEGEPHPLNEPPKKGTNTSYYRLRLNHNPPTALANALDNWGIDNDTVHIIINDAALMDEPDDFIWQQLEDKRKQ